MLSKIAICVFRSFWKVSVNCSQCGPGNLRRVNISQHLVILLPKITQIILFSANLCGRKILKLATWNSKVCRLKNGMKFVQIAWAALRDFASNTDVLIWLRPSYIFLYLQKSLQFSWPQTLIETTDKLQLKKIMTISLHSGPIMVYIVFLYAFRAIKCIESFSFSYSSYLITINAVFVRLL